MTYRSFAERNEERGYAVNRIDVLKTDQNEFFISIYHRGSTQDKLQRIVNGAMTAVERGVRDSGDRLYVFQYQIDHSDNNEKILFHPSGAAGQYENHYHLRSRKPLTDYQFIQAFRTLSTLQNKKYVSQELCAEIADYFFPTKNLTEFFEIKAKPEVARQPQVEYSFFDYEL